MSHARVRETSEEESGMALLRGSSACSMRSLTFTAGFSCAIVGLATESAEARSQNGGGRHGGCAKGEDHQHDGDKGDDGQDQGHDQT